MKHKFDELKTSCDEIIKDIYIRGINKGLNTKWLGRNILCYQILDSTQSEAHLLAKNGADHGTVIIAGEQRKGRGRLGRSWYSEKDKGVWISMILRPSFSFREAIQTTLFTSIVINCTLKKMYGIESKIKWPNDIYINDKKCAGILCEIQGDQEKIHYLIVGIGINTHKTIYPSDIQNKAISIEEAANISPKRLEIISEILNEFEKAYDDFIRNGFEYFFDQYIELMYGINKKIMLNKEITGYIVGIDKEGHLLVKDDSEQIIKVSSGEIDFLS